MNRSLFTALLLALSLSAAGQSVERARPAGTTPLEEPPPPPLLSDTNPTPSADQAEVTTRFEGDETIQEYRVNGRVFMQRVTPKHGKPYVLMDYNGDGTFVRSDHPTDNGVRVPQWVLLTF